MISKLIDILFSDNGERGASLLTTLLTYFGLDSIVNLSIANVYIHEVITGFIKMIFSVIAGVILYFILEYFKNKRNDKNGLKRDIGE